MVQNNADIPNNSCLAEITIQGAAYTMAHGQLLCFLDLGDIVGELPK